MFVVRLADSKAIVAVRKTLSGASVVAKKRSLTCPAKLEVIEVPDKPRKE